MTELSTTEPVALSIIIPVYGCAGTVTPLYERLVAVLEPRVPSFEIVFVDDRAPDGAWPVLAAMATRDPRVVALRLSRNFGQHPAITAALAQCKGARAIVMDCDLQDPPEAIPLLLDKAAEGHDIVFARRKSAHQGWLRMTANRLYFRLLTRMGEWSFDGELGSFSLISRKVIDAYLSFGEHERHYLFILYWLGFDPAYIDYDRHRRPSGESGYTVMALVRHALAGIYFQTTALLRWVIYVGFGMALMGLIVALVLIANYAMARALPGWTSLIVVQLVTSGIMTVAVGTVGLYVARIFVEAKGRPLYVVAEVVDRRADVPPP